MGVHDGRYAPSPTGTLHLGNLRTALLAWLFARSGTGRFLLRIEDIDQQRARPEHARQAIADLELIGIDWDGDPSLQSAAIERHRSAFASLYETGRVYPCWCTRTEIRQAAGAPHGANDAYPGTCRMLSARERSEREQHHRPSAWRLDAAGKRTSFVDRLRASESVAVDDFVLWRDDTRSGRAHRQAPWSHGGPAYNLAVVVDDDAEGIGEVVRGDDLLETTPRQVLLACLSGIEPPTYAHVPLVLGRDGARLAKRHGAVTLHDQLARGVSIDALVGWMGSSAGICAPGARHSAVELLAAFDPKWLVLEPTVWSDGCVAPE
jgi:glutamyl-tRNA synthetase